MTNATDFITNAATLIDRSTGDVWTALDNAGAWPADPDSGLLTFPDGSTLEAADVAHLETGR